MTATEDMGMPNQDHPEVAVMTIPWSISESRCEETAMPSKDQKLRDAGFKIHSRPKGLEPRWRFGRLIYTQAAALKIAEKVIQAKLKALEEKFNG